MTERTLTSTAVQNRAVLRTPGVNAQFATFSFKQFNEPVSVTLVLQMIAVPDQSRILDMWVRNDNIADGAFVVGDSSLSNRFITTTSLAAGGLTRMNVPAGIGYKVSLTASDVNGFYTINLSINSGTPTATATGTIAMAVYYTVDNPT